MIVYKIINLKNGLIYVGKSWASGSAHPWFGKKRSEDFRRKQSDAHKGEKGYWFGKKLSKAHRLKIAKSKLGKDNMSVAVRERITAQRYEAWKKRRDHAALLGKRIKDFVRGSH